MNLNIQFKIKSNPNYQRYLRENSHWYKVLNRNPESFNIFVDEMRKAYRLTTYDRINSVLERFQVLQQLTNIMK